MDKLDLNLILDRKTIYNNIKNNIINFEKNKQDLLIKRGIYLYGPPGSGKSKFIQNILNDLNYDTILYDAGEIRNKCIIENISNTHLSHTNVLSLFNKKKKYIAIIMDEIDGMNNGDKGGINSLIKLIRPKKTKKQKLEDISYIPIICIGNYHIDKKIKELIKVCNTYELKIPSNKQIYNIITKILPNIKDNDYINNIINYVENDLRKLNSIYNILHKNDILYNKYILNLFQMKSYNDDTKNITKNLIIKKYNISDHNNIMNETERTIIGLLWHENIIDFISKLDNNISIPLYLKFLDNICYADYIDRITFQKQIWQFNEISSLIKIFYNNYILHQSNYNYNIENFNYNIRFTKVLTKYSTEYNNYLFINNLCQILNFDKKDLFSFFIKLNNSNKLEEYTSNFEDFGITRLDINRIYRYIDNIYNEKNIIITNTDDFNIDELNLDNYTINSNDNH